MAEAYPHRVSAAAIQDQLMNNVAQFFKAGDQKPETTAAGYGWLSERVE